MEAKPWKAGDPDHLPWRGENIFGTRSVHEGQIQDISAAQ